jgi:hypothetical protein
MHNKFHILLITALFFWSNSYGQNIFPSNGNVGIGTLNPNSSLELIQLNPLGSTPKSNTLLTRISGLVGSGNIFQRNTWLVRDKSGQGWYTARVHEGISIDVSFQSPQVNSRTWWERDPALNIQSWGNEEETYMTIKDGNIGVGTTTPDAKLTVNGIIRAKEIKVEASPWPDYIFKASYKLPSLTSLKSYIEENEHLPGIPSEREVAVNGISLGEMNRLLLEKVEQLTLYLIEKDEQIKNQNERVSCVEKTLRELMQKPATVQ